MTPIYVPLLNTTEGGVLLGRTTQFMYVQGLASGSFSHGTSVIMYVMQFANIPNKKCHRPMHASFTRPSPEKNTGYLQMLRPMHIRLGLCKSCSPGLKIVSTDFGLLFYLVRTITHLTLLTSQPRVHAARMHALYWRWKKGCLCYPDPVRV